MRQTTILVLLLIFLWAAPRAAAGASSVDDEQEAPPRATSVLVAAVQCSSRFGDVEANRAKLTELVRQAAAGGARFIVLPEMSVTGYLSQDLRRNWQRPGWPIDAPFAGVNPREFAEVFDGTSTRHFAKLADQLDVYLTVPFLELARKTAGRSKPYTNVPLPNIDDARELETTFRDVKDKELSFFNSVTLVGPSGKIEAHYRKLTPWPHPEKSWATPGDRGVAVVDTEYGKVGLAICFDIHTIFDHYKKGQIWTLLYPIAWVNNEHPAQWFWHDLPRRAAANAVNIVGANWSVDKSHAWRGFGFSTILSSTGVVLASAHSLLGSEIVYARLPTAPN